MLLEYLHLPVDYARLLALLDISPIGAPRRHIVRLSRLGVDVIYREATLSILVELVSSGVPVVAFVDTGELPYWTSATNHALVVVGIDGEQLLVNDPAVGISQVRVPIHDFELAWLNADPMCAIIQRL